MCKTKSHRTNRHLSGVEDTSKIDRVDSKHIIIMLEAIKDLRFCQICYTKLDIFLYIFLVMQNNKTCFACIAVKYSLVFVFGFVVGVIWIGLS